MALKTGPELPYAPAVVAAQAPRKSGALAARYSPEARYGRETRTTHRPKSDGPLLR